MQFSLLNASVFRLAMVVTIGSFVLCGSVQAQSSWGSLGGSYGGSVGGGSSGYVASYGSFGSAGSHGSGGSTGRSFTPVRSLLRGIHDHLATAVQRHHGRRAAYASYGSVGHASTGFGSAGFGSSGFGSSGYSTSYGSVGGGSSGGASFGSVGTAVSYGSVGTSLSEYRSGLNGSTALSRNESSIYSGTSSDTSFSSNLVSSTVLTDDEDTVYLTVSLPSEASVFVNGKATTSTGGLRQFVSRGLVPGKTYKFDVRAELVGADGQLVSEEQTVVVRAGGQEHMQFAFADSPVTVETSLTVNVPEGAKVTLAGSSTRATGQQRTFHSRNLKTGEVWDDYAVEVEYNGQVKSQVIRLIGGDHLELSFQFDQQPVDQIASKS